MFEEKKLSCKTSAAVEQSILYLNSKEAHESLSIDPYWPKWNSPWWHMTLLWEMGLCSKIPGSIINDMIQAMNRTFLKFFPLTLTELPPEKNFHLNVGCHCALGTMYQVLCDCGVDMDEHFTWVRPWFLRYQLPDGGLNCDEQAYLKENPKSSIVSTLPPLEAILRHTHRDLTEEEVHFLNQGAFYLISHQLARSKSTGELILKEWLTPCFPRFYNYDILRGLSFLVEWAARLHHTLPDNSIEEAVRHLLEQFPDGRVKIKREPWRTTKTLHPEAMQNAAGEPQKFSVSVFPLLEETGAAGSESPWLSRQWSNIVLLLKKLEYGFLFKERIKKRRKKS